MNLTPFGEMFKNTLDLYKKKLPTLAVLFAAPFLVSVLAAIVSGKQSATTSTNAFSGISPLTAGAVGATALIFAIVIGIISLWIQAASIYAVDSSEDKPDISALLAKSWPMVLPLLLVAILVGLAVLGGLILLIVPGIIFAVWFAFSTLALVLDNHHGTAALKYSKSLVNGRFGTIFGRFVLLGLCLIGAGIVSGLVFAILPYTVRQIADAAMSNFVYSPFGLIFIYLFYKELKAKGAAPAATPAAPSTPTPTS